MSPDGMGWSWRDLEDTPPYVRKFCIDLLNVKRRAENTAIERARDKNRG